MPEPSQSTLSLPLYTGMHGAACSMESSYQPFLEFARTYLADLVLENGDLPDIYSRLHWAHRPPDRWYSSKARRRGRRLFELEGSLLLTEVPYLPGLQIEARWTRENLQIEAYYQPENLLRALTQRLSIGLERVYITLSYYMAYFPLIAYLNQRKGLHLLHAGAVSGPFGTALVAGLPGSGKSTLTLALLGEPETRLVSDNLVLFNAQTVYACPEPIHLSAVSRQLIPGKAHERIQDAGRDFSHGRRDFSLAPIDRDWSAYPQALFIVGLAPRTELQPISPDQAVERLMAYENLSREIETYNQFQAILSLHAPPTDAHLQRKRGALRSLVSTLDCFELWLERGGDMAAAVDLALSRIRRPVSDRSSTRPREETP